MDIILQNAWLQIALALLPAVIVAVLLLVVRKIAKLSYILLTGTVLAAFVFTAVGGTMQALDAQSVEDEDEEVQTISLPDREDLVDAAYAFLRVKDTESASRLVTEYAGAYGYDDTCSLIMARIAVFNEQYSSALGIYQKLYGDDLPEEAVAVEKIVAYNRVDHVLADDLSEAGVTQQTTVSEQEFTVLITGGVQALIEQILADEKLGTNLKSGAEWVAKANQLYDGYASSGSIDQSALEKVIDEMSDLSGRKLLNKLEVFREARLKVTLLSGDFKAVVDDIDEFTGCTEYMLALDLYLNKQVTKKQLTRAFDLDAIDGVDELVSQLKRVRDENEDYLDRSELSALEDQIDDLEAYDDDEVLYYLEGKLDTEAKDESNYKSASKIYISLAKLADEKGDDVERNQHFSDALLTAPDSDDSKYSEAMDQLAGTITGSDGSESVKDIPEYADQAIKNSYILPGIGEIIRKPEVEQEQIDAIQDYTVKAGAAVTINSVDVSEFNKLTVKVQLSDEFLSERELINLVRLNDCNYDIVDFDIEKVDYEEANIILCCDNSGSMSGSVSSLQNAVSKFIASSNEKETLGFYTFDNSMIQSYPLGSATEEELQNAIGNMGAYGGTNIFGSLEQILTDAPTDGDANQVIILMTDGQDGGYHTLEEIESVIGGAALQKGYIVYVLGMGSSIDTEYLTAIASSTGGQFIYSPSESELDSLYTFIHGALQNQYRITFYTKDTLTVANRKLTVSLDGKNVSDTRYYSLGSGDSETVILPFDNDLSVSGLYPRLIYKQKNITDVDIKGKGFEKDDSMSVRLIGDRTYTLSATYVNETTFRISVPAAIAVGSYSLEVYLNNRQALFPNELTVADGEPVEVKFGGYTFTAFQIDEYDDRIELSGYVTMNDWLHFAGDVTLRGNVENAQMTLIDYSGSYIDYTNSSSATGYAKFLKDSGVPQFIPAMGELVIYNAAASDSDYPTAPQTLPSMELLDLCNYYNPILRLYPDRITLEIKKGDINFPFQDLIFSETSSSNESPYSYDFDCTGTLSSQNISIKGNISGEVSTPIKLLDTKATMKKVASGKFGFDTMTNEYSAGFGVLIPGLPIDTYIDVEIKVKDNTLDTVVIGLDRDFTKVINGIPITFSGFKLGVTDMASKVPHPTYGEVNGWTLTGGMEIAAAKVSAVIPSLKKYVGDVSLLSIPDAEFKLRLSHFMLEASASLKLLESVTLAQTEVKLGHFDYENALLGLDSTEVSGVYLSLTQGLIFDKHNLKIELTGKGEGTVNSRFVGVSYKGTASLELNWWIFDPSYYADGQALVGFYKDNSGNVQFTVRASRVKDGKRTGAIFYITSDGDMDYDLDYKY